MAPSLASQPSRFPGINGSTNRTQVSLSPVYFSEPNCTGNAYIWPDSSALTPRAAVVADAGAVGKVLYATDRQQVPNGYVSYASRFDGGCVNSASNSDSLIPATFILNLTDAFPPPYEIE